MLAAAVALMCSCLSNDLWNYTYYTDTAITSFSLGTLDRYLTTISSTGEDSVYTTSVTGSNYKFYIDQLNREIYNPDSLPVATDASKVVCTVYTKNSGTVLVKNVDSDTLAYFSSSDSLDFTVPREFHVYSSDGTSVRKYTVRVNVHQEYPDTFMWSRVGTCSAFCNLEGMRAVEYGDRMMVFGSDGMSTWVYSAPVSSPASWSQLPREDVLDAGAYRSVFVADGMLWTVSGGDIMTSTDGSRWDRRPSAGGTDGLGQLLGAGTGRLYARTSTGEIASSPDRGITWEVDPVLAQGERLPTEDVGMALLDVRTNVDTERILVVGNRDMDAFPEDSVAMAWNKLEEYGDNSESHAWFLCNEINGCELPRLAGMQMVGYGDVVLALGGRGLGTSSAEPFSCLYESGDNGLTWLKDTCYTLPEGFSNGDGEAFAIAVDSDNYIWIMCGGDGGQVWRGRLAMMGWEEVQTSFVE